MSGDLGAADDRALRRQLDEIADQGVVAGADAVFSAAHRSVARRRRTLRVALGGGVAAAVAALVVFAVAGMAGSGNEGVVVNAPPEPAEDAVTISLESDSTEVVSGEALEVNVVVDNATGKPVMLSSPRSLDAFCAAELVVELVRVGEGYSHFWNAGCLVVPDVVPEESDVIPSVLPPGRSSFPVTVKARYGGCGTQTIVLEKDAPFAGGDADVEMGGQCGDPPLQQGDYVVVFATSASEDLIATDGTNEYPVIPPEPIGVEVLPADPVVQDGLDRIVQALASIDFGPARIENAVVLVEPESGGLLRIWPEAVSDPLLPGPAGDPLLSDTDMTVGGVHVVAMNPPGHGWIDLSFDCADGTRFRLYGNGVPTLTETFLADLIPALGCTSG